MDPSLDDWAVICAEVNKLEMIKISFDFVFTSPSELWFKHVILDTCTLFHCIDVMLTLILKYFLLGLDLAPVVKLGIKPICKWFSEISYCCATDKITSELIRERETVGISWSRVTRPIRNVNVSDMIRSNVNGIQRDLVFKSGITQDHRAALCSVSDRMCLSGERERRGKGNK